MESKFTVKPNMKGGYSISIGIGKIFVARTPEEIAYALEHYFRIGILNKPFIYEKHRADSCPLCRG